MVSRKCMKMSSLSSWYFFLGGSCETSGVCLTVGAVIHSKSRYKNRVVKSLATIHVHLRTLGYSNWVYKDPSLSSLFVSVPSILTLRYPFFMIQWYVDTFAMNYQISSSIYQHHHSELLSKWLHLEASQTHSLQLSCRTPLHLPSALSWNNNAIKQWFLSVAGIQYVAVGSHNLSCWWFHHFPRDRGKNKKSLKPPSSFPFWRRKDSAVGSFSPDPAMFFQTWKWALMWAVSPHKVLSRNGPRLSKPYISKIYAVYNL